jgi:hypothetical protein
MEPTDMELLEIQIESILEKVQTRQNLNAEDITIEVNAIRGLYQKLQNQHGDARAGVGELVEMIGGVRRELMHAGIPEKNAQNEPRPMDTRMAELVYLYKKTLGLLDLVGDTIHGDQRFARLYVMFPRAKRPANIIQEAYDKLKADDIVGAMARLVKMGADPYGKSED